MTYLWINPVSERMISVEALERMLEKHDLTRVVCRESWGEIVLRKYRELLEHADGTFADARCPAAVSLVHSLQPGIRSADIEPNLIHWAIELAERPDLADGRKIITTPCQILADMGNKLELKDTHFVPWNRFLSLHLASQRNPRRTQVRFHRDSLRICRFPLSADPGVRLLNPM